MNVSEPLADWLGMVLGEKRPIMNHKMSVSMRNLSENALVWYIRQSYVEGKKVQAVVGSIVWAF